MTTPEPGPPENVVSVENRQRRRRIDTHGIQALVLATLHALGRTGEIGIHLVGARRMAEVNWQYLRHEGSTDVITFDHGSTRSRLHGELFVCVDDAARQAVEFGTTWREEVARYVIHGILHLAGYDDLSPGDRKVMKRAEGRLVRKLWHGRG